MEATTPLKLLSGSGPHARRVILDALRVAGPLLFAASDAADSAAPESGIASLRALRDRLTSLLDG